MKRSNSSPSGAASRTTPLPGGWVVCKTCERWNLSPLETRWEAIDQAERQFRATKMRASTDNIGLARLRDGTELVRIGKPLPGEFAAWRYGDQFGKRHRKTWMQAAGSMALVAGSGTLTVGSMYLGFRSGGLGLSALGLGIALNGAHSIGGLWNGLKTRHETAATVRDTQGELLRLTYFNAREVTMIPTRTPHGLETESAAQQGATRGSHDASAWTE